MPGSTFTICDHDRHPSKMMTTTSTFAVKRSTIVLVGLSILLLTTTIDAFSSSSISSIKNVGSFTGSPLIHRHAQFHPIIPVDNGERCRSSSSSTTRHSTTMGLFRRGSSGIMGTRKPNRGSAAKTLWNRCKFTNCRSSVSKQVRSFYRSTKQRIHSLYDLQQQRRRSILAAAALAFSVVCVSSSGPQNNVLCESSSSQQPSQISRVMPSSSSTLRVTGGSHNTGSQLLKRSKFLNNNNPNSSIKKTTKLPKQSPHKPTTVLAAALPKTTHKVDDITRETTRSLRSAIQDLQNFMGGTKSDTLILLLATALITPICKQLNTSPILGFLAAGMLLGPNGWGLISKIHTTETLAELGIVFFLFEMGIELSVERLISMKKDVFGLGLLQFCTTASFIAFIGSVFTDLSGAALIVLGGGLALSSSAFVLQILKDKDQLATRFGKASFGVLLFQDLAVVPLLVVTPILAGGGKGLAAALSNAVIKAALALGSIAFAGRVVLNPLFKLVAQANSQEAFLGVILLTVLSMSFLTEGLGLSNTLGAFLAGVLLSETKYRYQVEADIAPFRGILLGLFFVTVGFEIDLHLIASTFPLIPGLALGIVMTKALITTLLSLAFKLSLANSQQTGLILSQGGEFAFVAFGLARGLKIFDEYTTKVLLTSISLTMALTPLLTAIGGKLAKRLEEKSDFSHYLGQDQVAIEIKESDDFVIVVGYGKVGKVVCDMLGRKFIKYVVLEIDPNRAIQARNKGLPVFFGDIGRSEVAEAFNTGKAKAVVVTIKTKPEINRAVTRLRRGYPDLKIFARAVDLDHADRLQTHLDVAAMVPILPEDDVLLTLPFGGAVLKALGSPAEEVNAILEQRRKELLSTRGLAEEEEKTVLLQLGIDTKKENSESGSGGSTKKKKDSQKTNNANTDPSGASTSTDNKTTSDPPSEKNPMVAQVIQANMLLKEPEKKVAEKKKEEEENTKEEEQEPVTN